MSAFARIPSMLAALAGVALLAGCERPPVDSVQYGYRGTGMVQVYNPRTMAEQIPLNQPPAAQPATSDEGPKAKEVFKNLQVLGDLSVGAFTRQMLAITSWVAPNEGCVYCHNAENLADDGKYQKVVARRMIQMTQKINADWKPHVAATGVTCYTCHRGNNIPAEIWFTAEPQNKRADFIGNLNGQNYPATTVGLASLPNDPYTPYLQKALDIRIAGNTPLPTGNRNSIQHTEQTYGLMMHMSKALGVNCTYCHNTRSFGNWQESSPKRTTAWHGIRMVRELNNAYMQLLTDTFPATRKGPTGDVAKVYCATCHQGAYKPLYGAPMAKDYPELLKVGLVAAAAPAPLPPPVAEAARSVLYFDVGSAVLQDAQAKGLAELIGTMTKTPAAKATISGFHSAAGTLAQNQELAKQRAFTVRDSLLAAGIAEARVTLAKPQQTEANVAGEDPTARRVEVTVK